MVDPQIVELYGPNAGGEVIRHAMPADQVIKKYRFPILVDPNTLSGAWISNPRVSQGGSPGMTASEKVSGSTSIGVYTNCKIDVACSGAIALGEQVKPATPTAIKTSSGGGLLSGAFGYALETGSDAEIIEVRIKA